MHSKTEIKFQSITWSAKFNIFDFANSTRRRFFYWDVQTPTVLMCVIPAAFEELVEFHWISIGARD